MSVGLFVCLPISLSVCRHVCLSLWLFFFSPVPSFCSFQLWFNACVSVSSTMFCIVCSSTLDYCLSVSQCLCHCILICRSSKSLPMYSLLCVGLPACRCVVFPRESVNLSVSARVRLPGRECLPQIWRRLTGVRCGSESSTGLRVVGWLRMRWLRVRWLRVRWLRREGLHRTRFVCVDKKNWNSRICMCFLPHDGQV